MKNTGLFLLASLGLGIWASPPVQGQSAAKQWGNDPYRNMAHEAEDLPADLTEETLKWEVDFRVRNIFAQPMVIGDKVLLGTGGGCFSSSEMPEGEKTSRYGILWCLQRETGKVLWRFIHRSRGYGMVSQPTQEGDRLYVLTSAGVVCCLDLDGLTDGNDGMDNEPALIELDAGQDPGKLDEHVANSGADVIWAFDMGSRLGSRPHDSASGTPLIVCVADGLIVLPATGGIEAHGPK